MRLLPRVVLVVLASLSSGARADNAIFNLSPRIADAQTGLEVSYFRCPCFRWTVNVELAGGEVETRDFLISTDALFAYQQRFTIGAETWASRTFRIGALEALVKGARLGLAFHGVTVGEDRDRGYSEIFQAGMDFLVSLVRTDAARLELRTGYDFERMRFNEGPFRSLHRAGEALTLRLGAPESRVRGDLSARLTLDFGDRPGGRVGFEGAAGLHVDALRIDDFFLGLGARGSFEYDPLQLLLGNDPRLAVVGINIDLGFVPRADAAANDGRTR